MECVLFARACATCTRAAAGLSATEFDDGRLFGPHDMEGAHGGHAVRVARRRGAEVCAAESMSNDALAGLV